MTMSPMLRKLTLTAHVTTSVGWLGAVLAFLALAVASLASDDAQLVRSTILAMELTGWFVLVPLSVVSLLTGLVQSLGTKWGLLQHYWIVVKLVINVVATGVLLLYMQSLVKLSDQASSPALSSTAVLAIPSPSAVVHAGVAVVLLLVATVLSVYKPAGMTRYGQRKQQAQRLR